MRILQIVAAGILMAAKPAIRLHFDADLAGAAPAFLRFESTPGLRPSGWRAIPDKDAVTLENIAVQTKATGALGQYRFALSTEAKEFVDGKIVVSIKRKDKTDPCRGGLVVRFRNPQNFLGIVYDLSASTIAVVSVENGKSKTLASGSVTSSEPIWRTIGVDLSGSRVAVTVSGKAAVEAMDPKPVPGSAGMLAEGGSIVGFDELLLEPR